MKSSKKSVLLLRRLTTEAKPKESISLIYLRNILEYIYKYILNNNEIFVDKSPKIPINLGMIKMEGDEDLNFYLCESADWKTIVLAEDFNEAAAIATKLSLKVFEEDALISAIMRVKKINEDVENHDTFVMMEEVLADIGMHKESRGLKEIMENVRNKRDS